MLQLHLGQLGVVHGGNNAGGQTNSTNVTINGGELGNVYGGGRQALAGETYVILNNADSTINNVYGGGYSADVTNTNISVNGVDVTNIFGGSNTSGTVTSSNILANSGTVGTIYGGNNAGGETTYPNVRVTGGTYNNVFGGGNLAVAGNTNVRIDDGTFGNVFGGGNEAEVSYTNVQVNGGTISNLYGGGNAAGVTYDTNLNVVNGEITVNVYGGGEEGAVYRNTFVDILNTQISGSLYAGGNGVTATVYGNTNLSMHGNTTVGDDSSVSPTTGCVFGGGNAAATGTEGVETSSSTVNMAGGSIYGNVYGGANTSVVYGNAFVYIGYESIENNNGLTKADIYIRGTIFGGGEANASGSEIYDFDFISVTKGIDMSINGSGHSRFKTEGSIFGSGNASSTSGESHIYIKNFGTKDDPQRNISIQRATIVILDNSAVALNGATDRTNEYSGEYFSLSRVDEVKLKNDSTLYLNFGANLLKKLTSVAEINGTEVKSAVDIDEETGNTTRNVDNRIYMREGRNLNVATNEQVTAYGEVNGMMFLGLYTSAMSPHTSTGPYHYDYENNDFITNEGTFSSNSYVLGMHKLDHDITVDGFYTNYNNEGYIKSGYVGVTPEDDLFYIWLVGENMDVTSFEITLTASKYSTLGTTELSLTGFGIANTKFMLAGFSAGLADEVSLIDKGSIPAIANTTNQADTIFGLGLKTGNVGWSTGDSTQFYTANGGSYRGSTVYDHDNSNYTPTLAFYLYHSQNIARERDLGEAKIRFQVLTPVDDLNYSISYVDINITMRTALYQDYFYEASIAPGEQFELFTTTETNITDKSKFSTYYALYLDNFSTSTYASNYFDCKHVLVSRNISGTEYSFPANTKITMIDKMQNKYYYYVVTAADESSGRYIYNLSDFIEMGSSNQPFDEPAANRLYYKQEQDIVYENFIFHVDFKESTIPADIEENLLLMELHDQGNNTLLGVLGIQRETTRYSVYKDRDPIINISGVVSPDILYLGNIGTLALSTNYSPSIYNSKLIYDTKQFTYKMGVKLSIYDSNNNQLSGDSLLGLTFILNNKTYYPRMDGTVRISVADKLSNVLSRITIDSTNNTTLATGTYTIKAEAFGSPDGICYGFEEPQYAYITLNVINGKYGLKVTTDDTSKIVNKTTGKTLQDVNTLPVYLNYTSVLSDPNIAVVLERRDYTTIYSRDYETVDLKDYITNDLIETSNEYEYKVTDVPEENSTFTLTLKENLTTGTYKLTFKLYNNDTYIGEAYEYIVIR